MFYKILSALKDLNQFRQTKFKKTMILADRIIKFA